MIDITLYAIPQCDTVKKSRAWFDVRHLPYRFHDYKKLGVPLDHWDVWQQQLGRSVLINRQGSTWRKLSADLQQQALADDEHARQIAAAHPSVIKRPVVEWTTPQGVHVSAGWAPELWEAWQLLM